MSHHCSCGEFRAELHALVDRELNEQECARLEEHVRGCPSCTEKINNELELRSILRKCCQGAAPNTLRERISYTIRSTHIEIRSEGF
ncbi:mycothiol system anti-sigma-R factor [Corynebacterium sp. 153RC1]|uniref:mycothiol system anti-sigma-R factor n=1 Tax=Corynebacterium TaxID=1716 RepID=UPI00211CA7BF|nr:MULTISPECIES: mycothiol system anti-sigma-R factor [unclassified Corynebacterium]MCQ9371549.1 mycothiol system anti-sigma-R factor [Corynebacterium sp. 35RC1]MCQ9343088.1 mycothiol system anti-sigma-R factor [Corynebacterium sp. 76QC2CO]MCQ9352103.1 mycothiol system anti-sigma-R factor [Corynebacterium sp. 209RC1]MCQ9354105.1 mycothiol system anti-sigma-R factor [Corynebacterium sp. 1222RC1]MCQ9356385.1 mycothiol system anti-sigma-R factor [Corynebacterium sp. 122RC1]